MRILRVIQEFCQFAAGEGVSRPRMFHNVPSDRHESCVAICVLVADGTCPKCDESIVNFRDHRVSRVTRWDRRSGRGRRSEPVAAQLETPRCEAHPAYSCFGDSLQVRARSEKNRERIGIPSRLRFSELWLMPVSLRCGLAIGEV
jgi:hypothetical protein